MKDSYIFVDQFRGSHYEYGMYQSKRLKESNFLRKMNTLIKNDTYNDTEVDSIISILKDFSPDLLEEISGLAFGLDLSINEAIHRFSGYFYSLDSGCSIIMSDTYMVRNYDQHPQAYDGRLALFEPTNDSFASIGPSMIVTGRTDGMNEKGFSIGYNFVTIKNRKDGFTCNVIARILLEKCTTVEDGIEMLKKIPHRTSFNYCLLDANGKFCIVEVSSNGITVRYDHVSANHFIAQTEDNHKLIAKSENRYRLMQKLYSENPSLTAVYQGMNDANLGIFAHDYHLNDGTIHTAIYQPASLTAIFSYGANRVPVSIDFKSWKSGSALNIKKIRGRSIKEINYLNEV